MPTRCPHGATLPPCATVRCYCNTATSHNLTTTPKVASMVNIPPHAQSSHPGEGMAWALLAHDKALEDDFQTQYTPVCHVMRQEDTSHRSSAEGRLECSGGSPRQQTGYQVDIGEEEEMLEMVDPTWRTTRWLQLAVQGILDEEVPWYEYIEPLMTGTKGMALSLAKCPPAIWQWSARVQGWDVCSPAPTVLNIGQFMMRDEVQGDVDNSLWLKAYSCALQRVREAVRGWRWQWLKRKAREVSPLVKAFWEATGIELTTSCTRLCWELPPRGVYRRERGAISHAITFLDYLAVRVPTCDAWDQFVWLLSAAMPRATTEVEQYGYCCGNAVDLGVVMLAMEFRGTDKEGVHLCAAQGLIFEGSILAYNAARDKAEWVPTHGVTNDLSWAEERTAVVLVNFVPHIPQEVDRIAELGARCLLGWADDSPSEEDDEQTQEEEDEPEGMNTRRQKNGKRRTPPTWKSKGRWG